MGWTLQRAIRVVVAAMLALAPASAGASSSRLCGGVALVCSRPRVATPPGPAPRLLRLPGAARPGGSSPVARWTAAQLATLAEAPRPVLEAAAEALLDGGRAGEARGLFVQLAQGASDEQNCVYEALLLQADRVEGKLARASVVARVAEQLRRLSGSAGSERCAAASLEAGASVAAELHGKSLAGDRDAGRLAAEVYDALLPAARPGLRFPRLAEPWPTPSALRFARGALAWSQSSWEDCGRSFLAVDAEDPEGPDAAVFAGRCFARRVDATAAPLVPRGEFRLTTNDAPFRPMRPWEQEALEGLDRAACAALDEQEMRVAAARLLLSVGRPGEAAAELRAAVERAAPSERAEPVALFLEAAGRASASDEDCIDEAEGLRQSAWKESCAARPTRPGCAALERFDSAIARAQAGALRRRAEAGAIDGAELNERAGRLLHDAARRCALDPIDRRDTPTCERPEELLWASAEAFAAGRFPLKSIRARQLLLVPRYRMQRTEQARRGVVAIARSYESLADFEEAVSWYENFATGYPSDADAAPALERAVQLRLALGQETEALDGVELLRSRVHRTHAGRAVAASLSLVQHHARRGSWEAASRRLEEAWRFVQEQGTTSDRVVAHALRGRIRERLGRPGASEHRAAVDLWTRGGKPGDEAALEALAEARLDDLGRQQQRAAGLAAPALRGRPSAEALLRHLGGPLRAWLGQRRQQVEALERGAEELGKHDPPLPPRWVAAARVRAFEGWLALEREASSPRWTGFPGVLPAVQRPLDDLLEPLRERVTSAAWACFRGAVQAASFDESTQACERWLGKHADYRPVDESLMPRPGWLGLPPSDRPAPMP